MRASSSALGGGGGRIEDAQEDHEGPLPEDGPQGRRVGAALALRPPATKGRVHTEVVAAGCQGQEHEDPGVDVDVVSSPSGKIKPQPASNRINIYIKNPRIPLRINPGE